MAMSHAILALGAAMCLVSCSAHPLQFGFVQASERPISKVVNMMKDMLKQLEVEQETDEKTYDAMVCWCETGNKQKSKAISDAEAHTANLAAAIEELTAKSQQLTKDIENLGIEIAKNEKALDESAAVRAKELAEFNQEEKDAIQGIGGLKGALQVLGKHNEAALSQQSLLQVQSVLMPNLSHAQMRKLGFSAPSSTMDLSFLQTSARGSGEIFGVMQAMKENFEANLAKSTKEEKEASDGYAQMKAAKQQEVAAATKAKESKEVELAQASEDLENSRIDNKDTLEQLDVDREFLANLKKTCAEVDAQWEARQKMRQDETTAVNEAVKILTDDDARDLAAKTTSSASFLQTSISSTRSRVAKALREAGKKFGNPQLSLLALTLKSDVFAKIKQSIDQMVAQLKVEQKDEVKHKDWCREQLQQLELDETEKYDHKGKQETKKADLAAKIAKLVDEIKAANNEITDTQIEMKSATENREKESKEFTTIIADQRAMHTILGKALGKLKAFYGKKALLQKSQQMPEQPAGFEPYKKQGGSGGVVGMIEGIMKECAETQKHAIFDNHESQMAYEEFMMEANKSVLALRKSINDKTAERSEADADTARNDADLQQTMKDLEALSDYSKEIHGQCDFVMNNFKQRQDARVQEMDALNEAKMIMN